MEAMIEHNVSLPVVNPDTGCASRTFYYRGKVDLVEGGKLTDWKSAKDPQRFVKTKKIGFQAELYALALHAEGIELSEIEYRIIAVPLLQFVATRGGETDYTRKYGGDVEAYEQACYEWLTADATKLIEHTQPINRGRLEQAKWYLHNCGKRILDNRRAGRWLPNESACYTWERECEYMPLCEALASGADVAWIAESEFEKTAKLHPELDAHRTKKDVLTYSSMSILSLCEVKYYWRYEQRLRKHSDYAESLWLGSAMHAGLEGMKIGGMDEAYRKISEWENASPILGEFDGHKQQQIAKARAMVRAANLKWETNEL